MKIKKIDVTHPISENDLENFKKLLESVKHKSVTALDFGIDLPIISIDFGNDDTLILLNPVIIEKSKNTVVYFEKDSNKSKFRKVIRHTAIKVETSNLGKIDFQSDRNNWKDADDFYSDFGLEKTVTVQRLIDAINGIDILSKERHYNPQIISNPKIRRNDKVMMQNTDGDIVYVKYKDSNKFELNGYKII